MEGTGTFRISMRAWPSITLLIENPRDVTILADDAAILAKGHTTYGTLPGEEKGLGRASGGDMGDEARLTNRVRPARMRRGWSQDELARRSGVSRAGISAIETGRLVPSTAAALAIASALDCSVEDLFSLGGASRSGEELAWAWPAPRQPARYWKAEVGGRVRAYPAEPSALGTLAHDGTFRDGTSQDLEVVDPSRSLVMACCDPAVAILARELAREAEIRLIVLTRSSRRAIDLLEQGLVHLAGIHLARADEPEGNAMAAARLGAAGDPGPVSYRLLRVADWEEGIAVAPGLHVGSVRQATREGLRWVGREPGSGARQCLDEVLNTARGKGRSRVVGSASDHRGVATAVRDGWADAGVCLRLASDEAGLDFLSVRSEAYDLCFVDSLASEPRLKALVRIIRSPSYRRLLGSLPGYDSGCTGEIHEVRCEAAPRLPGKGSAR
jgi:molybdate-binding protein/DNA-binding XRE family transcriptional regulator